MNKNEIKTEKDLFRYIRENDKHICNISWKIIREPKAWCFAHVLWKWMYKKHRLDPNNIILVYWPVEHRQLDSLAAWKKFILETYLKRWIKLTVALLKKI